MNVPLKYSLSLFGLVGSFLSLNANAASFDCTQATQQVEKMICSDNEFSG